MVTIDSFGIEYIENPDYYLENRKLTGLNTVQKINHLDLFILYLKTSKFFYELLIDPVLFIEELVPY